MQFVSEYTSPLGEILLAADEAGITGLWFESQKYYAKGLDSVHCSGDLPALDTARRWLDIYFTGKEPDFLPPLCLRGSTFRVAVWKLLLEIPYGKSTTYGAIARELARRKGLSSVSAQAVGGAVGHNPISLIIPCHRVLGSKGSLTGYAGGLDKKEALLRLEGADLSSLRGV